MKTIAKTLIKQSQKTKMKAISYILTAALILQAGNLFANNSFPRTNENKDANVTCCVLLIPTTPAEATFDDVTPSYNVAALAPVTPAEADFSDTAPETTYSLKDLAPVVPTTADFDDDIYALLVDLAKLAPETPVEADFE
jgi:hypothetical protein